MSTKPRVFNPTHIAARLDLTDEKQHWMHAAIQRTHTGRWPLWQALAMRQIGPVLVEAVRWNPRHMKRRPEFGIVRWNLAHLAVTWTMFSTEADALTALRNTAK